MPTIDIYDLGNNVVGSMELAPDVFDVEVNVGLMHESVRHYLAGRRAGTHKTKARHEVSGSGKKLWRQKGTGRARMGSVRSPLWRHGGTVHGPQPRDYSFKLNKKMQAGAVRSALTAKLRDGEIKVVRSLEPDSHKTGALQAILAKLTEAGKVLLVDNEQGRNLLLASRNLPGVTLVTSREMETYHLLAHQNVILSEGAANQCAQALAGGRAASSEEEAAA
ncbi:MAG: 50S ribosomal protein L4 [Acidobacteria bacterium]|nr:50S ribosomal protein L4 [Acidobacteriota bacterium]